MRFRHHLPWNVSPFKTGRRQRALRVLAFRWASEFTLLIAALWGGLFVGLTSLGADAAAEAEVAAVHKQYVEAWAKQDVSALDRLLADGYVDVGNNGKVVTKAEALADARTGALKLTLAESQDVRIQIFGATAIVRGKWRGRGTAHGKPFDGSSAYTTVYAKTEGKWKAVVDQGTPVRSTDGLRAEIEAAEAAYVAAFNSGNAAAMARNYTEDAQIFPNEGEIVAGRPAIEEFWKGLQTGDLQQKATTLDVIDQGDFATETGTAVLSRKDRTVVEHLKYIVIWKRTADDWKVNLETWNKNKK